MAVRTKAAAGRACRSTPAGRATVVSELVGTTGLLGGADDVLEPDAAARRHRGGDGALDATGGGDGALDDRGVGQPDVAVGAALEQRADGEDRGTEVAEHADAAAAPART